MFNQRLLQAAAQASQRGQAILSALSPQSNHQQANGQIENNVVDAASEAVASAQEDIRKLQAKIELKQRKNETKKEQIQQLEALTENIRTRVQMPSPLPDAQTALTYAEVEKMLADYNQALSVHEQLTAQLNQARAQEQAARSEYEQLQAQAQARLDQVRNAQAKLADERQSIQDIIDDSDESDDELKTIFGLSK